MASFSVAAVLQLSMLATSGQAYSDAYKQMADTGCPLVVLVGADWCPACVQMKNSVIPQVLRRGGFNGVAFAQVNADHDPALAQRLTGGGGAIPQLIVFHKSASGWQRQLVVGAQSITAVESMVDTARRQSQAAVQPVSNPSVD